MPINACSINKHGINSRCAIMFLYEGDGKNTGAPGLPRRRDEEEFIDYTDKEHQYITIDINMYGVESDVIYQNVPIDRSQIVFINNLRIEKAKNVQH